MAEKSQHFSKETKKKVSLSNLRNLIAFLNRPYMTGWG